MAFGTLGCGLDQRHRKARIFTRMNPTVQIPQSRPTNRLDASHCPSPHSLRNPLGRAAWNLVWTFLYRPSPRPFHGWRRLLLRCLGARIGSGVHAFSAVKIWAPWNLEMGDYRCLSHDVDCYCVAKIKIGVHATVSKYGFLCAASHDVENPHMPLITAPITIADGDWIAADDFIGPGVTVGEGAVVGERSGVFRSVEPWSVVVGSPARFLKPRQLLTASELNESNYH